MVTQWQSECFQRVQLSSCTASSVCLSVCLSLTFTQRRTRALRRPMHPLLFSRNTVWVTKPSCYYYFRSLKSQQFIRHKVGSLLLVRIVNMPRYFASLSIVRAIAFDTYPVTTIPVKCGKRGSDAGTLTSSRPQENGDGAPSSSFDADSTQPSVSCSGVENCHTEHLIIKKYIQIIE